MAIKAFIERIDNIDKNNFFNVNGDFYNFIHVYVMHLIFKKFVNLVIFWNNS